MSLLRITIPADLYQSGILAEVEGVEIQLRIDHDSHESENVKIRRVKKEQPNKRMKAERTRSTQPFVHDPGGNSRASYQKSMNDVSAQHEGLPTTDDLAASFLEAEPEEKKAQLQATFAESQILEEAQMHDNVAEDTSATGLGNGLSPPKFLADFLKGVRDRLRLKVKDVCLDLSFPSDVLSGKSSSIVSSDRSESVSLRLVVEGIDIEGLTEQDILSKNPRDALEESVAQGVCASRQIKLRHLRGIVRSDSSVFESLSLTQAPLSLGATHVSSPKSHNQTDDSYDGGSPSLPFPSDPDSETQQHQYRHPQPTETRLDSEADEAYSSTTETFHSNVKDKTVAGRRFRHEEPKPFYEYLSDSSHSESSNGIQFAKTIGDSDALPIVDQHGPYIGVGPLESFLDIEGSNKVPPEQTRNAPVNDPSYQSDASAHSSMPSLKGRNQAIPHAEDLTQSRIFSHEEAESMYMSAISHASLPKQSHKEAIPGGWSSDSDEEAHKNTVRLSTQNLVGKSETPNVDELKEAKEESDPSRFPVDYEFRQGAFAELVNAQVTHPLDQELEPHSSLGVPDDISPSSPHHIPPQASSDSTAESEAPLAISKEFLYIGSVTLRILQQDIGDNENLFRSPRGAAKSPGSCQRATAASNRSVSRSISDDTESDSRHNLSQQSAGPPSKSGQEESSLKSPNLIDIKNVEISSDMVLLKLALLIARYWTDNCRTSRPSEQGEEVSGSEINVNISLNTLKWNLLDIVKGFPTAEFDTQETQQEAGLPNLGAEVLLKTEMKNFKVAFQRERLSSKMHLSIGKATFGYLSEDIVSFDTQLKMRESTRDILAPVGNDIAIDVSKTAETLKIDMTTLPLRFTLNLRRIDETLSWLGGFSTVLGLGSSMMSTATIVDKRLQSQEPLNVRRGVRFDTLSGDTHQSDPEVRRKFTARLGGLACDLIGSDFSLHLEGSALKLVSRTEGLGIQIDRFYLSGPSSTGNYDESAMSVRLFNTRIEYLPSPKEVDLDRLLALLSPSNENHKDDGILIDTLLRQRRQGGIVRITVENVDNRISNLNCLDGFSSLAEDFKKLATVAKYLPQDDRPGILTLILVRHLSSEAVFGPPLGVFKLSLQDFEIAYVTLPSLIATGVKDIQIYRNSVDEELLGKSDLSNRAARPDFPRIRGRFIGNEMEPVIKITLENIKVEYHVTTVLAILEFAGKIGADDIVSDMANSVVLLAARRHVKDGSPQLPSESSSSSGRSSLLSRVMGFDLTIRDSIFVLNPFKSASQGLLVLTDTHFFGQLPKNEEACATLALKKALLMVIDDKSELIVAEDPTTHRFPTQNVSQTETFQEMGFVTVGSISAAKASVQIVKSLEDSKRSIDIEIKENLLVLETCADSTQTLQNVLNGLKPPRGPSSEIRYRTEVVPVENMLASLSGNAFAADIANAEEGEEQPLGFDEGDMVRDEVPQNLEFVSSFYNPDPDSMYDEIADSMLDDDLESLAALPVHREIGDKVLLESFQDQCQVAPGNLPLDFQENHFGTTSTVGGTAHRWNTRHNTYGLTNESNFAKSPLKVRVRDVHVIWNLFDGYDWQKTRDKISQVVADVESKAQERLSKRDKRKSFEKDEEEESVIGDFLFNSTYIGIPANRDPRDLARQINRNLDDLASETGSNYTATAADPPSSQSSLKGVKGKKLRFARSRHHKMTFEMKGIAADLVVFPPQSGEIQNSIDIRVQDLDIFDHVPTSTWKKFATYMHDAGERESGTSMIHIELLNVQPVPDLAASEIVLKVIRSLPR